MTILLYKKEPKKLEHMNPLPNMYIPTIYYSKYVYKLIQVMLDDTCKTFPRQEFVNFHVGRYLEDTSKIKDNTYNDIKKFDS